MNYATVEQLLAFEKRIKTLWEAGELPYLLHLSGGNEEQLVEIFKDIKEGDWIFSTHRSHYHYLLAGGSTTQLETLIASGNSMFIYDRARNFLTSSIVAGNCCIAAGVALALKQENSTSRVWCFVGDGAEDEGHFYEAVSFVDGLNLPCTFIIEDNNRSVETTITQRGRGIPHWPVCVRRYTYRATYPHAGSGCKFQIKFKERAP